MEPIRVHFAPELRLFLSTRNRAGVVRVAHDGTASLGHVVTSLGVPLTEVGTLSLNGRQVGAAHRPDPGDVVDVGPVRRPQAAPTDPPRFVLDVHLGTLARRLRILGVDAAYRTDAHDDELVAQAASECRVLLSRDRGLLRRRAVRHGAFVRGQRPDDQLADVLDRFDLAVQPLTRCTACNALLESVDKVEVLEAIEPGTRRSYDEFARCVRCGRVYWRGAHHARLAEVIEVALRAPRASAPG